MRVAYVDTGVGYEEDPSSKHVVFEVPDGLKGYRVPDDIGCFISGLLPNMEFAVSVKVPDSDPFEVINDFCVYMLGRSRASDGGRLRWSRYDNESYPGVPYYRWWLVQLDFFVRNALNPARAGGVDRNSVSINDVIDSGSGKGCDLSSMVSMDVVSGVFDDGRSSVDDVVDAEVSVSGFDCYLMRRGCEVGASRFHRSARRLMWGMAFGYSNAELAKGLGVSQAGVGQWKKRLRDEAEVFFRGRDLLGVVSC